MRLGQEVHILSGDSRESVSRLGDELKVPGENLHPEHSAFMKENWIKQTQEGMNEDGGKGKGVIMVGDGNYALIFRIE
jgi:cation transport ATPase